MLKLLDESNLAQILSSGKNSALGTRVICYALAYGFGTSFVDFWAGDNVLISRFDDVFTIVASSDADFNEIDEFIDVLGCVNLVTDAESAKRLRYADVQFKRSFEYKGQSEVSDIVENISDDKMYEAYKLISSSIPGSFSSDRDAYLSFLSDFRFRQNRGFARGKCIITEDCVAATSVTSAETSDAAVISGVACRSDLRGTGYGKNIVTTLAEELKKEGKTVYVIALNEAAEGFYRHIGFEECENIAYIKRC